MNFIKFWLTSLLFLVTPFAGANESQHLITQAQSGYYIIENVDIKKGEDTDLPKSIEQFILQTKDTHYFHWNKDSTQFIYYENNLDNEIIFGEDNNLINFGDKDYQLSLIDDKTLEVNSNDCLWWQCSITFRLIHVAEDSPQLKTLQDYQTAQHQKIVARYLKQKQDLANADLSDFVGFYSTSGAVTLKLPLYGSDSPLERRTTGVYYRWFDDVLVRFSSEEQDSVRFYQALDYKLTVTKIQADKNRFDLERYLAQQNRLPEAVLLKSEFGAVYHSTTVSSLEAFYYQYNEKKQEFTFVTYSLPSNSLTGDLAVAYMTVRSIDPKYLGEQIDASAAGLSRTEFEDEYTSLYDAKEFENELYRVLQKELEVTRLFRGSVFRNNLDISLNNNFYNKNELYIFANTLEKQMADDTLKYSLNDEYHVAYQDENSVIFVEPDFQDNYLTYFYMYDNGLTYRLSYVTDPKHDYLINHLKFIQTLRQIKPIHLNQYPQDILNLIHSYSEVRLIEQPAQPVRYKVSITIKDMFDRYYGIIDENIQNILPAIYQDIIPLDTGYIAIDEHKHYQLFDLQGKALTDKTYHKLTYLSHTGVILAEQQNKYGYPLFGILSVTGQELVPVEYTQFILSYDEKSFALVKDKQRYSVTLKGSPVNEAILHQPTP
ncbi:hypothetical protein [Zophobihabitans entericus]|uniref:Uncharacterized protein n=1 Tax=Zophobihabitans entericus TaxID=1635327 RepID=A0A6G9IBE3_9GAMM|nr:hypothetical protein [Zophobihabitans entericus]QIQ20900.1 hypothetical protein IPMB12_03905 [Zophobihabitans entericus]